MERKFQQQFKKGSLELILLCLVSGKETYGYEIMTNLNKIGGETLGLIREGTVYPILYRLEESGIIQSREAPSPANGRTMKYYSITEQGTEYLKELRQYWRDFSRCVDSFISLEGVDTHE